MPARLIFEDKEQRTCQETKKDKNFEYSEHIVLAALFYQQICHGLLIDLRCQEYGVYNVIIVTHPSNMGFKNSKSGVVRRR
jgi:hypothetical protein